MSAWRTGLFSVACALAVCTGRADELVYRGHLEVDDSPYTGSARLKFAILDAEGRVLWRNDRPDADGIPQGAVDAKIENGEYEVVLGRPDSAMAPLPPTVPEAFPDLRLRIWVAVGRHRFRALPFEDILSVARIDDHDIPVVSEQTRVSESLQSDSTTESVEDVKLPPVAKGMTRFVLDDRARYHHGADDAALVLIEYSDFSCWHCRLFHEVTYPKIVSEYVKTEKIQYIASNFPLRDDTLSGEAAEASFCAGDQGQYWAMRHLLFESPLKKKEEFVALANRLDLDVARFFACLDRGSYAERVAAEKSEGERFGIVRTPTFVLARRLPNGHLEGKLIHGSKMWTEIKAIINSFINAN